MDMQHTSTDRRTVRPLLSGYEDANTGMRIAETLRREMLDDILDNGPRNAPCDMVDVCSCGRPWWHCVYDPCEPSDEVFARYVVNHPNHEAARDPEDDYDAWQRHIDKRDDDIAAGYGFD